MQKFDISTIPTPQANTKPFSLEQLKSSFNSGSITPTLAGTPPAPTNTDDEPIRAFPTMKRSEGKLLAQKIKEKYPEGDNQLYVSKFKEIATSINAKRLAKGEKEDYKYNIMQPVVEGIGKARDWLSKTGVPTAIDAFGEMPGLGTPVKALSAIMPDALKQTTNDILATGLTAVPDVVARGMRGMVKGGSGILDKDIAAIQDYINTDDYDVNLGMPKLGRVIDSTLVEDAYDFGQGFIDMYSITKPGKYRKGIIQGITTLAAVFQALPPEGKQTVLQGLDLLGRRFSELPVMKDIVEQLPPEKRSMFGQDMSLNAFAFLASTRLRGLKGILKEPGYALRTFAKENFTPGAIIDNLGESILNIEPNISKVGTRITEALPSATDIRANILTKDVNADINTLDRMMSTAWGVSPETVDYFRRFPEEIAEFKEGRKGFDAIQQQVLDYTNKLLSDTGELGKIYEEGWDIPIKQTGREVIASVRKALTDAGLAFTDKGFDAASSFTKEGKLGQSDLDKIYRLYKEIETDAYLNNYTNPPVKALQQIRRFLDDTAIWAENGIKRGVPSEVIKMRNVIDEYIKQVPGMQELDAKFSSLRNATDELKSWMVKISEGEAVDMKKTFSALVKGERGKATLEVLEKYFPNIKHDIEGAIAWKDFQRTLASKGGGRGTVAFTTMAITLLSTVLQGLLSGTVPWKAIGSSAAIFFIANLFKNPNRMLELLEISVKDKKIIQKLKSNDMLNEGEIQKLREGLQEAGIKAKREQFDKAKSVNLPTSEAYPRIQQQIGSMIEQRNQARVQETPVQEAPIIETPKISNTLKEKLMSADKNELIALKGKTSKQAVLAKDILDDAGVKVEDLTPEQATKLLALIKKTKKDEARFDQLAIFGDELKATKTATPIATAEEALDTPLETDIEPGAIEPATVKSEVEDLRLTNRAGTRTLYQKRGDEWYYKGKRVGNADKKADLDNRLAKKKENQAWLSEQRQASIDATKANEPIAPIVAETPTPIVETSKPLSPEDQDSFEAFIRERNAEYKADEEARLLAKQSEPKIDIITRGKNTGMPRNWKKMTDEEIMDFHESIAGTELAKKIEMEIAKRISKEVTKGDDIIKIEADYIKRIRALEKLEQGIGQGKTYKNLPMGPRRNKYKFDKIEKRDKEKQKILEDIMGSHNVDQFEASDLFDKRQNEYKTKLPKK